MRRRFPTQECPPDKRLREEIRQYQRSKTPEHLDRLTSYFYNFLVREAKNRAGSETGDISAFWIQFVGALNRYDPDNAVPFLPYLKKTLYFTPYDRPVQEIPFSDAISASKNRTSRDSSFLALTGDPLNSEILESTSQKIALKAIYRKVGALPKQQRRVFMARFYDSSGNVLERLAKFKDIARELKMSESGAKLLVKLAIETLRKGIRKKR